MFRFGVLPYWLRFIDSGAPDGGSGEPGDPDTTQQSDGDDGDDGDGALGDGGMKALKAEREANKANRAKISELEAKLKEFVDRDKTEAEKTAEKLAGLEKSNERNAAKALRLEIAIDKGLPKALAARLQGSTREELEADADNLMQLVSANQNVKQGANKPKPDPSQGAGGTPKPHNLADAINAHYKS